MKSRLLVSGCLILMFSLMGCSEQTIPLSKSNTSAPVKSSVATKQTEVSTAETPQPVKTPIVTNQTDETPQKAKSAVQSQSSSSRNSSAVSQKHKISAAGIGAAKVGMTFEQLKKVLGTQAEFQVKSPFMVDYDAIAVSFSGKLQYYIIYPAETTFTDSQVIESLITDNPDYRTRLGVGPGTPLKQAEAVYGDVTLFYNTENESREYVKFAKQPARNIAFRPHAPGNGQLAGIYPSSSDSYHVTKEYQPNSTIGLVLVECHGNTCAKR